MAERVCPVWIGYLLASPIRRLLQSPEKILGPYIKPGMTVLDAGCAMGYFSIPAARMVGPEGRVVCVDLQAKMIRSLQKRAVKAKVSERIETRVCSSESLEIGDLAGQVDFVLAFAVVHEAPDLFKFIKELSEVVTTGGHLFVSEPKGHVTRLGYQDTLRAARENGMVPVEEPTIASSLSVLFLKPA